MNRLFLLLGSNEGDRAQWFRLAEEELSTHVGGIVQASSLYETAAWGKTDQPDFLNKVLVLETELCAEEILQQTRSIEERLHRQRSEKWGQRTLDIDILFYNDLILDTPELKIPHPFLHQRRFTLMPLNEVAPLFVHPVFNSTVAALLDECPDDLPVRKIAEV